MGGACSTNRKEENWIKNISRKMGREQAEYLAVPGVEDRRAL
jgi:hypothetical protein